MNINKKGFSASKLLIVLGIIAVVVLVVIPLIATLITKGTVDDVKDNAHRDAAYGIVRAIEQAIAQEAITNQGYRSTCEVGVPSKATIGKGTITVCGVTASYKVADPTAVTVVVNVANKPSIGTKVSYGSGVYTIGEDGQLK